MHPFIPVLSPSHPYIPTFKSKDFSFTCLFNNADAISLSTVVLSIQVKGMVYKGGRQDRDGWMHVAMVMTFEP